MLNASRHGRHVSYNKEVNSTHLWRENPIEDGNLEDSMSVLEKEMEDIASEDNIQRDNLVQEDHRGDSPRVSSSSSGLSAYQSSRDPSGECKGKQRIVVDVDKDGGDNASTYTSELGQITRTHCPISIESFKDVANTTKKAIWKHITDEFVMSSQFKKIAKLFREQKHSLRKKNIMISMTTMMT